MLTFRALSLCGMIELVMLCLTTLLVAFPASSQSNNSNFVFLLASGFLCVPGDSSACPVALKANGGDSYEMSGAGAFDTQSKSVRAAGTFTHNSPNGNVLETGVWLASELVSFDSYGAAPTALPRLGVAFRHAPMSSNRIPIARSPTPTGGLALFRILLMPTSGLSSTAVLQMNCALGDVPRERSVEAIRLTVERNRREFSEETRGRVIFLATGSELSTAPQQEISHEPSDSPHNSPHN